MSLRSVLSAINDRLFRGAALREARARLPPPDEARARALQQSRLLAEVARRVAHPVEKLPTGARPAVEIALYRDVIYWATVAGRPAGAGTELPPDLRALWAEMPPEEIARGTRDAAELAAIKQVLSETSVAGALETKPEDAERVRAYAEARLADLDMPRQRVERLVGLRWAAILVCLAVLALLGLGLRKLLVGPNLLADKPFRTSSTWAGCAPDPGCSALLFHTDPEESPWVEFDFGKPTKFHRVEVTNRDDCCAERTIPLVVESSLDRVSWTQLARRDTEFHAWTIKVAPRTARYLKLKVPRNTVFHLKDVAVR